MEQGATRREQLGHGYLRRAPQRVCSMPPIPHAHTHTHTWYTRLRLDSAQVSQGHRVSRPRGTGSVGSGVGEGTARLATLTLACDSDVGRDVGVGRRPASRVGIQQARPTWSCLPRLPRFPSLVPVVIPRCSAGADPPCFAPSMHARAGSNRDKGDAHRDPWSQATISKGGMTVEVDRGLQTEAGMGTRCPA